MEDWSKKEPRFCYMLLDRLRQDCEYYLRIGGSANCLWADSEKVDFNKVLAEAKSKGYKYSKNAIHSNDYLMKYNDSYFRIGLVDITYGVLDEGEKINVYFNGKNRPITIENDLGIGIVLPIRTDGELEGSVIVEVKGDKYESETEI